MIGKLLYSKVLLIVQIFTKLLSPVTGEQLISPITSEELGVLEDNG